MSTLPSPVGRMREPNMWERKDPTQAGMGAAPWAADSEAIAPHQCQE